MIRRFEEALLRLFGEGMIDGTTHTCLGQEYVPVALTPLLAEGDYVFSNHRGHGHYLARHQDPVALLAEIMGRAGGVCEGVGGSQHLHQETFFSTGVQGESLPLAVGAALHLKRSGGVALAYIGDGTFGAGAVYEALNMASLWDVPVIVAVENNRIAQTTPIGKHMAGSVRARAAAFDIAYRHFETQDLPVIRNELAPVFRSGSPLIIEFDTVRLGPHSKGDDTRDEAELHALRQRDWCAAYETAFPELFAEIDARARRTVQNAIAEVVSREPAS
ncbi:pyruvate dehydrogenase E1 component alpha subunit [Kibdelosporangium banguiense]|uniref:Pyruvate dehydrogenase E1 component alpha subunit n=1 Tax=Kibdelosporangium banguiense TaxID=1365924 RepID=A0ABS4TQW8_9PSEU|nr:thiamine pyrophosphate-dependent dehydrogenase E1 component subunit alpha [Kibdelosporangium banguiense]MBP2326806.1 pyruvate dehydrogenase E1 component alpha subunit [Kibdelosporangium banguiense]